MSRLSAITHILAKVPGRSLLLPFAFLAVLLLGWTIGLPAKLDRAAGGSGGEDTVWTCSMHPQVRQPNPGLCPICAMDLIAIGPGGDGGLREVAVSAEASALMDLRVSPVTREPASVHVDLFGKIAYDERKVTTTTARVGGRLDRFFIDYTGAEVREGDHVAEIYSPALFVAQQDLINATRGLEQRRKGGTDAAVRTQERLLRSARERLRLLQLTDTQIDGIAAQESPSEHITIYAQQDGIVTRRHVVEGAYVKEGESLFSVASLDTVWLNLEAYESDLPWLKFAQDVAFTVEAIPGQVFHGRVAYIDPEIDAMRRVVRVRVNVPNPFRLLKPGMFARATVDARVAAGGRVIDEDLAGKWISPMHPEIVRDGPGKCPICGMALVPAKELGFIRPGDGVPGENPLLVPASAVLKTGRRSTVYVRLSADPAPVFEGREIVLGSRVGDRYIVVSGLVDGELVVTRGAFKLDSELQLKAKPSMMNRNAGLTEIPAAEAAASLLGQWGAVPRALGRLSRAVESGDQTAAHASLADMEAALQAVDTAALPAKTLPAWREFSHRLENTLARARRTPGDELVLAYRDVRHAVEETGRYLGLPHAPVLPKTAPVDDAEVAALRRALDVYYTVSTALAADDFTAAQAAADALAPLLDPLEMDSRPLRAALDLATLRQAFEDVSDALIARVESGAIDRVGNAYVVHCPMAFDNAGADWLSPQPAISNPYFGSEMLTCGTVQSNLSFAREDADAAETPPAKAAPEKKHAH